MTSLLAITAGMLNAVSNVLSQQSAAETRIKGLLEKQFVHDPVAMLIIHYCTTVVRNAAINDLLILH